MKQALALLAMGAVAIAAAPRTHRTGVLNPERARVNWMLKCQGCHRPDGTGSPETAPPLSGQVAKFLGTPGGRDYLARVPGVATSALPDDELAELLNWSLETFDPQHLSRGFRPYSVQEIAALRKRPLRIEAAATRARIIAELDAQPPQLNR